MEKDIVMRRGFRTLLSLAVVGAIALAACGDSGGNAAPSATTAGSGATATTPGSGAPTPDSGANNPKVNLSLVAFSVPQTANAALEAAFRRIGVPDEGLRAAARGRDRRR